MTTTVDPIALASDHLYLCDRVARRLRGLYNARYSIDDARQDAWFGLVDAARTWDPDRCPFPAWAWPRVRSAIRRGAGAVAGTHGRRTLAFLPATTDQLVHQVVSIDAPTHRDDPTSPTIADTIPAPDVDPQHATTARLELAAAVAAAEHHAATSRDRLDRVVLAWMLDLDDTRTQADLAATFGVHPQRVWRRRELLRARMRAAAPTLLAEGA